MIKLTALFFILIAFNVAAQNTENTEAQNSTALTETLQNPPLSDIIEGVGIVVYTTAIRQEASRNAATIRAAIPGERVLITAFNDDWYAVRVASGRTGFMERRFVKTSKVFIEESFTRTHMDKRISVEIGVMVNKFNQTLTNSVYADKYQVIPRLAILASSKDQNIITVNIEYSAIDRSGAVIPSRQDNLLANEMRSFLGALYLKMLSARADAYRIVITQPVFSPEGNVLNTQGEYAAVELAHQAVDIKNHRDGGVVFSLAESTMEKNTLFGTFPH